MILSVAFVLALLAPQAAKAPALPDTPQGRHVAAYLAAFNSGDEAAFVLVHDDHFSKSVLEKVPAERRKEMFRKMQGDFGKLTVEKLVKATDRQIVIQSTTKAGDEATFTFDFEEAAPFKISGIGVDVRGGSQPVVVDGTAA